MFTMWNPSGLVYTKPLWETWHPYTPLNPKFIPLNHGSKEEVDGHWNYMGMCKSWYINQIKGSNMTDDIRGFLKRRCTKTAQEFFGEVPNEYSSYCISRWMAFELFPGKEFPAPDPDPVFTEIFEEYLLQQNILRHSLHVEDEDLPELLGILGAFFRRKLQSARLHGVERAKIIFKCNIESGHLDLKVAILNIVKNAAMMSTEFMGKKKATLAIVAKNTENPVHPLEKTTIEKAKNIDSINKESKRTMQLLPNPVDETNICEVNRQPVANTFTEEEGLGEAPQSLCTTLDFDEDFEINWYCDDSMIESDQDDDWVLVQK